MAIELTFRDGAPAKMAKGKYQTRTLRIVEIDGSRMIKGETNGREWTKKVWDGNLMNADTKTIDTRATWSDDGHYLHEEGVQSPFDLCLVITQEDSKMGDSYGGDTSILDNQLLCAALVDALLPYAQPSDDTPLVTLNRLIEERNKARPEPVPDMLYVQD